jgi:OCT family organic cation transporter-like MFS transporter 4/5
VLTLLLATNLLPVMFQRAAETLYTAPVRHHCRVPGPPDTAPLFLPPGDGCSVWRDPANHSRGVAACPRGLAWHHPPGRRGLLAEWDLACERAHLAPLLPAAFLLGLLLGGLCTGWLADRLGRRPVMLACLYGQCLLAVATHLISRLAVFLAVRVLQGLFVTGLQVTTYCLVLELVGPEWRGVAAATLQVVWTAGMVLVAVVAKFIGHWRYVQLALHIPTLATLLYIW